MTTRSSPPIDDPLEEPPDDEPLDVPPGVTAPLVSTANARVPSADAWKVPPCFTVTVSAPPLPAVAVTD